MKKIDEIFNDRTCYKFSDKPVDLKILKEIYDLMKLGPTSANCCPLRIIFVQSKEEKEKLCKCVADMNVEKIRSAPITAIFAYDLKFYNHIPTLFAHNPGMKDYFASDPKITLATAFRNSTLQAAYFMMITRGRGLACGGMSGFNEKAINEAFFSNTDYQANFLCNIGYRDGENEYPRLPRLDFTEACRII